MLFLLKQLVTERDAGRNQLRDTSLYYFLGQLRIFKLVADSDFMTGPYKPRKINIQRMMRKSGHRY